MPIPALSILIFLLFASSVRAQFYQTTTASIHFFSSAPIEDIEALSKDGVSVINSENGEISFQVAIRSFQFEKSLMQEHFNENLMESERFPKASFRGKSTETIDVNSFAPQKVNFEGVLTIHGVSRERIIPVVITINDNGKAANLTSEFKVEVADHDIKIPRLLWNNIAEIIAVTVNAEYQIID